MRIYLAAKTTLGRPNQSKLREKVPVAVVIGSFPARRASASLTIKCMLSQTVSPVSLTVVVGWSDQQYKKFLEKRFSRFGVRVVTTPQNEDWLGYKKFFPADLNGVDFVLTLDDDIALRGDWLEQSFSQCKEGVVNATRGAWIDKQDISDDYSQWKAGIRSDRTNVFFSTNGAGTFFPPEIFCQLPGDYQSFSRSAPTSDDIWTFFKLNRAGIEVHPLPSVNKEILTWPIFQRNALWKSNRQNMGNDCAIKNLKGEGL